MASPQCQHGEMQFKQGTNARGPWRGYFCPAGRTAPDRCEPQFLPNNGAPAPRAAAPARAPQAAGPNATQLLSAIYQELKKNTAAINALGLALTNKEEVGPAEVDANEPPPAPAAPAEDEIKLEDIPFNKP